MLQIITGKKSGSGVYEPTNLPRNCSLAPGTPEVRARLVDALWPSMPHSILGTGQQQAVDLLSRGLEGCHTNAIHGKAAQICSCNRLVRQLCTPVHSPNSSVHLLRFTDRQA